MLGLINILYTCGAVNMNKEVNLLQLVHCGYQVSRGWKLGFVDLWILS